MARPKGSSLLLCAVTFAASSFCEAVPEALQSVCGNGSYVTKDRHNERVRAEHLLAFEQFPKWNARLPLSKVTFTLTLNPELLYVCARYSVLAFSPKCSRQKAHELFHPSTFGRQALIVCSTAEFSLQSTFHSNFRRNSQ
jgi:hypothetical protein